MNTVSQPNLTIPSTEKLKKEHSTDNLRLCKNIRPAPVPLIKNDIIHRSFALYLLFHFNILFFLIYIIGQSLAVYFKYLYFDMSFFSQLLMFFILILFVLIEPVRLNAISRGNRKGSVPAQMAALALCLFPQAILNLYFAFIQSAMGSTPIFPIEFGLNIVYILLIASEFLVTFKLMRTTLVEQSVNYQLYRNK